MADQSSSSPRVANLPVDALQIMNAHLNRLGLSITPSTPTSAKTPKKTPKKKPEEIAYKNKVAAAKKRMTQAQQQIAKNKQNLKVIKLNRKLQERLEGVRKHMSALIKLTDEMNELINKHGSEIDVNIEDDQVRCELKQAIENAEQQQRQTKKLIETEMIKLNNMKATEHEKSQNKIKELQEQFERTKTEVDREIKAIHLREKDKKRSIEKQIENIHLSHRKAVNESKIKIEELETAYNAKKAEYENKVKELQAQEHKGKLEFESKVRALNENVHKKEIEVQAAINHWHKSLVCSKNQSDSRISSLEAIKETEKNKFKTMLEDLIRKEAEKTSRSRQEIDRIKKNIQMRQLQFDNTIKSILDYEVSEKNRSKNKIQEWEQKEAALKQRVEHEIKELREKVSLMETELELTKEHEEEKYNKEKEVVEKAIAGLKRREEGIRRTTNSKIEELRQLERHEKGKFEQREAEVKAKFNIIQQQFESKKVEMHNTLEQLQDELDKKKDEYTRSISKMQQKVTQKKNKVKQDIEELEHLKLQKKAEIEKNLKDLEEIETRVLNKIENSKVETANTCNHVEMKTESSDDVQEYIKQENDGRFADNDEIKIEPVVIMKTSPATSYFLGQ